MRSILPRRWMKLVIPGVVLFQLGGCLGPNPGFFISTSAANAAIMTIVNTFLSGLLQGG